MEYSVITRVGQRSRKGSVLSTQAFGFLSRADFERFLFLLVFAFVIFTFSAGLEFSRSFSRFALSSSGETLWNSMDRRSDHLGRYGIFLGVASSLRRA